MREETIKIAFLGHDQVGKTQCRLRAASLDFKEQYIKTVGIEFSRVDGASGGSVMSVLDFGSGGGNAQWFSLRGVAVVCFFIDPTNEASLDISHFVSVKNQHAQNAKTIVVVSKCDLQDDDINNFAIQLESVKNTHSLQDAPEIYCSAKEGTNIQVLVDTMRTCAAEIFAPRTPDVVVGAVKEGIQKYIDFHTMKQKSKEDCNRGYSSGWLSIFRHGAEGMKRARALDTALSHQGQIKKLIRDLGAHRPSLHRHSLNSYIMDALFGFPHAGNQPQDKYSTENIDAAIALLQLDGFVEQEDFVQPEEGSAEVNGELSRPGSPTSFQSCNSEQSYDFDGRCHQEASCTPQGSGAGDNASLETPLKGNHSDSWFSSLWSAVFGYSQQNTPADNDHTLR